MTDKDSRLQLIYRFCGGLSAFIGVAAMSFVIGRITAPSKSTYNVLPVHVTATQEQVNNAKERAGSGAESKISQFYSTFSEPRKRVFHFGNSDEESPGIMILPGSVDCLTAQVMPEGTKKVYAVGDVAINNFQPFTLIVSDNVEDHPEYLSHFRPDEISGLLFTSPLRNVFRDDALSKCTHLKLTTKVTVESSNHVTDSCLAYLDRLPNLVELRLPKTAVTGAGVANMPNCKKFTALDLSSLVKENGGTVLSALENSTAIKELSLRQAGLNDDSANLIGSLVNLEKLDISGNAVSDVSIAKFANLKHLRELNVFGCTGVTPKSFESLAKYPALKVLTIGMDKQPDQFSGKFEELQKLLHEKVEIKQK